MRVNIDIESFSEVDLKATGVFPYSEHPSTFVRCMSAALSQGTTLVSPIIRWIEGASLPPIFWEWAADPSLPWVAHNAGFEITMLNGPPGQKIGFPKVPVSRWIDTAVKCAAHGLPRDLDGAGSALNLGTQKDKVGHAIMLRLCRPRKPSKNNPNTIWWPKDKPAEFDHLYRYCDQDVLTTIAVDQALDDIPAEEQRLWELDYEINSRGYLIDVRTVDHVIKLREEIVAAGEEECAWITEGVASSQRERILDWCYLQGVQLAGYTKEDLITALAGELPDNVRRVLEIRQSIGRVSTKKFAALARGVCSDNRLRGTLMFYGAGTGRWSGRIFQPQNIAKGTIKDVETACEDLWSYPMDDLGLLYGDSMEMLSSLIRPMIIASDGKELVVCDYSSIEARVVQWLANDEEALEVFRTGKDNYRVMASEIYSVPYESIPKSSPMRQVGKQAILGLGYAMGWKKFISTCWDKARIEIDAKMSKQVVATFRRKYKKLKDFWYSMDRAAIDAIKNPGIEYNGGGGGYASFFSNEKFLFMKLPSGRRLAYYMPWVTKARVKTDDYDFETEQINFWGVNGTTKQWEKQKTYGGSLVENLCQAVARDLLCHGMQNLEQRGFPVVLHVHDEAVCETSIGLLTSTQMEDIMCELPAWAGNLPIKAEGFVCQRYRK